MFITVALGDGLENFIDNNEKLNFDIANSKEIEESFSDIEKLLLKAGYLQPHTANAKISKFKKFISS